MRTKQLRKEFQTWQALLRLRVPFVASLLSRLEIVATDKVPTAAVDANGRLLINPAFMDKLSIEEKAFVLGHEAMHIALRHLERCGKRNQFVWNIAGDLTINTLLLEDSFFAEVEFDKENQPLLPEQFTDELAMRESEIERLSADQIYHKLMEYGVSQRQSFCKSGDSPTEQAGGPGGTCEHATQEGECTDGACDNPSSGGDKEDGQPSSGSSGGSEEVIQEGDSEVYTKDPTEEELDDYWKRAIAQASVAAKQAGKLSGGMEQFVDSLLKAKVDWMQLLKQAIRVGLGKQVVGTYVRPSRRFPLLPATRKVSHPDVWILLDTSGSIVWGGFGGRELEQLLSEIAEVAKTAETVHVIPWDTQAYDTVELQKPADVLRKLRKVEGGGGTMIGPALDSVAEQMETGDVVVVLTDGYIGDIRTSVLENDDESFENVVAGVGRQMLRIRMQASVAIFATTGAMPNPMRGWRGIEVYDPEPDEE